ncbi:2334_t:CDS:2 [Ambispora leptoticha]|uniref:2334_t:CDS:1 n=1 Tax=Ambispora leptoticha TaxID=144679 RepID=A0A9N9G5V3_9GLOM|nr:2334_t:CDS:2 [Ambispora leptoticha]
MTSTNTDINNNYYKKSTTNTFNKMPINGGNSNGLHSDEPKLYISKLPANMTEDEVIGIFNNVNNVNNVAYNNIAYHNVKPIKVDIKNRVLHFANRNIELGLVLDKIIVDPEKAYALYNKSDQWSLHLTDPNIEQDPQPTACVLEVKQFPPKIDLYEQFRKYGPIYSLKIPSKGRAYIQYFHKANAEEAVNKMSPFSPASSYSSSQTAPQPQSPGPEGPLVDPCNLFIKNLDANITSSDLFNHFRKYGRIISARVMRDQETNTSKGFGFVSYTTAEEADRAKQSMNNKTLGTKQIYPINAVNEYDQETLSGLAPKARTEILSSELQKRFKNIAVPQEEVGPIIEHLLKMKIHEVLHILKDPPALTQKIHEARASLQMEKKQRRGSDDPVQPSTPSASASYTSAEREKLTEQRAYIMLLQS